MSVRPHILLPILAGLVVASALASLGLGAAALDWQAVWQGARMNEPNLHWLIFWELRVPRTALALLVGAALGVSGALLQGWTRNPLAEPGLLGTSACAGLGSVLAMTLRSWNCLSRSPMLFRFAFLSYHSWMVVSCERMSVLCEK